AGVSFYLETNGAGGLQVGSDTPLGAGVNNGTSWTLGTSTAGFAPGGDTGYAVGAGGAERATGGAGDLGGGGAGAGDNNFASGTVISGTSLSLSGSNVGATKEVGEPNHAGNTGGKSVWWTWTATASGRVYLDTTGSNFDTLLAVYTGNTVGGLTRV